MQSRTPSASPLRSAVWACVTWGATSERSSKLIAFYGIAVDHLAWDGKYGVFDTAVRKWVRWYRARSEDREAADESPQDAPTGDDRSRRPPHEHRKVA